MTDLQVPILHSEGKEQQTLKWLKCDLDSRC